VVAALGIDPAWLPPTFEGTAVTGPLSRRCAKPPACRLGIPVVGGGGDQAANAVGTGAVVDGVVALSLGTSAWFLPAVTQPIVEPDGRLHAFCHAVPGKWHLMGVMLSAAGSLRWFRDTWRRAWRSTPLLAPAAAVPPAARACFSCPTSPASARPTPIRWRAAHLSA
jgi:xylulokinase